MSMSPEHVTKKRHSSGIAIIGMSWLTMTLGLFFATLAGKFVSTIGAADWMVHLTQAVVIISIVLPVLFVIRRHFHMKSVLLPLTGKSIIHLLSGALFATSLAFIGLAIASMNNWITITEWHFSAELFLAVVLNSCIAFLYEALPEELSMRGMVYDGLRYRLRLPVFFAYVTQVILFLLVPISVSLLQELVGMDAGNRITLDYMILILTYGITLQLLRSLTGSLWASIGFHIAYLEVARFVVMPGDRPALLNYTAQDNGLAEIFILYMMIIFVGAIILAVLNAWRWWRIHKS
ncbi:CPBP family glutamic-type intramembrane protease [Paenibacillus amylolyticus]|uniref:CPBP family glutamic-type intramembrane protease n=1 Tax=Paenibacillus amylolyticus TaxID=1451 RepID=UPI00201DD131|nr:CPBP family glutamic-type intramembrane protease [Paenibacillus amylolyticus]MCL6663983.1 CPBP family intramembrane metalloprotease domain-containing protein [Paenibacillus amylolyticus]